MSAHLSGKYNVCLKSNCNDARGPYRGLVTTREARMGAQSHISPDLSHEHRAVLQEISPILMTTVTPLYDTRFPVEGMIAVQDKYRSSS